MKVGCRKLNTTNEREMKEGMETIGTPEYYLEMLAASLEKKEELLKALVGLTGQQEQVLAEDELDMEAFDKLLQKKQSYVERLEKMDQGFEQVYQRIRETIQGNPGSYRGRIQELQEKIGHLTEIGVSLEVQERRNKERFDFLLSSSRSKIRNYKVSNQAAAQYYKNMANRFRGDSYFVDKKK